ncbi:hypothetical protein SAY87_022102 [Trapa incisa]|uniref:Uncharacterized protein n=1 Tax=Trapa incisa TaxID=236973 RepID=A0AAN7PT05_9MYRT|nr:hypothetical protein SAY87_022102 [Trapa incisa]
MVYQGCYNKRVGWTCQAMGSVLGTSRDNCKVSSFCGMFGSCDNVTGNCRCLEGFRPSDSKTWEQGDFYGGCVRKVTLQCEEISSADGEKDEFLMIPDVVTPLNPSIRNASREHCKVICQGNCFCSSSLLYIWKEG